MPDQDYIDNAAGKIAAQLELVQKEVVIEILGAMQKTQRVGTAVTLVEILNQFNFKEIVRLKAQNVITNYTKAHTQMLTDMKIFGKISEESLRTITNFSTSIFADKLDDMANILKSEIIKGALGAGTEQGILQAIQARSGLSNTQMRTLVTTGLNDYSRSVNKVMMDTLPSAQKYRYDGPLDDSTRDECVDMINAGELTENQIISQFSGYGDVLISGGGFNCRHQWMPIQATIKAQDVRTDA